MVTLSETIKNWNKKVRTTLRFWSKVKTAGSVHVETSLNIIRQNVINLLTVFRQKLFEFKSLDLSMGLRLYLSLLSTTTFFFSFFLKCWDICCLVDYVGCTKAPVELSRSSKNPGWRQTLLRLIWMTPTASSGPNQDFPSHWRVPGKTFWCTMWTVGWNCHRVPTNIMVHYRVVSSVYSLVLIW